MEHQAHNKTAFAVQERCFHAALSNRPLRIPLGSKVLAPPSAIRTGLTVSRPVTRASNKLHQVLVRLFCPINYTHFSGADRYYD